MQQVPPTSVGPACTGEPTSSSSAARHTPENTSQHSTMLSLPGKTPLLASLGAVRKLLGSHQSSTPDPVQHCRGAQRLRYQRRPFLACLCLVSFPPLLPSNSRQGGWWDFMAHPGFGMCGGAGQRLGSAGSFPRAGNGPVPFGSEGERASSFSYVHRGAVFAHPVNGSARGTAHRGRAGCREAMRWLQPGPVETRRQWGCGGVSLRRGSVRDGGWRRGLPASKGARRD